MSALTTPGDEYVLYTCSNIKGYSDAVAKAKAAEPTLSDEHIHDSLCKIKDFAVKYSFLGSQYVKNQDGRVGDDSPKFDVDSIMMYSSWGVCERRGCVRQRQDEVSVAQVPSA
jgi:hypothetical protein